MPAIQLRGAAENNLRGVDLDIQPGSLTVLCGVSGSGKTSLLFDTLHVEGQRRYLDALGARMTGLTRPKVDVIRGLPPTLALDQRAASPSTRSTAATIADVDVLLRVLFAREGTIHCPRCENQITPRTVDEIVAALLEGPEGARLLIEAPIPIAGSPEPVLEEVLREGFSRVRVEGQICRIEDVRPAALNGSFSVIVDRIRRTSGKSSRIYEAVRTAVRAGRGVMVVEEDGVPTTFVEKPHCLDCDRPLRPLTPALFSPFSAAGSCEMCAGTGCDACRQTGMRAEARAIRWQGATLPDLLDYDAAALLERLRPIEAQVAPLALAELRRKLTVIASLHVETPLGRRGPALAGGEVQRLRLARLGASTLSGVLFLLDEPAAGVSDPEPVIALLRALRDQGATVLVVSHLPDVVRAADRVIEFGPGAGDLGGRVVFDGSPAALEQGDTPSGRWFSGRECLPVARGGIPVEAAGVQVLRGGMTAIVGPSGSGKSHLLKQLANTDVFDRIVDMDARAVRRSTRSLPATYVGLWDQLRTLLSQTREAQIRGFRASDFSLNRKGGRCEACKGTGIQRVELEVLPDALQRCPICDGDRFGRDILDVRWRGHHAAELLALPAEDARRLLSGHPKLDRALRALTDVGLGYVPLGQPTATLSGGEARRLKLARELVVRGTDTLYLLDDPTRGLHPADSAALLNMLGGLCGEEASVVLATSDPAVGNACARTITLPG